MVSPWPEVDSGDHCGLAVAGGALRGERGPINGSLSVSISIPELKWTPSLDTGLAVMDDDHKRLFSLFNGLARSASRGISNTHLHQSLDELTDYTERHFREELVLMQRFGLDPAHCRMHLAAHRNFISFLDRARALAATDPADTLLDILSFLSHWLLTHVFGMDAQLVAQIQIVRGERRRAQDTDGAGEVQDVLVSAIAQLSDALGERTFRLSAQRRRLTDLQNLYQALVVSADVFIKGNHEQEMLQSLCARLSCTVFHTAWIGRPGRDGIFEILAIAGRGSAQVQEARPCLTQADTASLVVQAWRKRSIVVANHTLAEPTLAPWHETFAKNEWHSLIAVPINRAGKLWAVLALASPRRDTFDEQTVDLCARIASLLSHGLDELDLKTRIQIMQSQESRSARTDAQTGLPNRRAFNERMEAAVMGARADRRLAVVMMDLDGFKPINDTYGHETGDRILEVLARRLRQGLREGDFVARWGGDEFVVLLEDCGSEAEVDAVLDKLGALVGEPMELPGLPTQVLQVSAGVAVACADQIKDADELVRWADRALYDSKEHRGDRLRFWSRYGVPTPRRQRRGQVLLREHGFDVLYQPVFDCRTDPPCLVRVEALPHVRDEQQGHLSPTEFLADLDGEDRLRLTKRLLAQCLADMAQLDGRGRPLAMSLNIDAASLTEGFVAWFMKALAEAQASAARFTLEIYGGGGPFEGQGGLLGCLSELRASGVRLALEDAGSLYSSLLRFKDLPIDEIKLDQAFVRTLEDGPEGIIFIGAFSDLARSLGMNLIVEGVETPDILDAVSVLGLAFLQGYSLARPMLLTDLTAFLDATRPATSPRPATLLGVYARQVQQDQALRRHRQASDFWAAPRPTLGPRPLTDDLARLGVPRGDPLHALHEDYHRACAAWRDQAGPGGDDAIERAHRALLGGIARAYQSQRRG